MGTLYKVGIVFTITILISMFTSTTGFAEPPEVGVSLDISELVPPEVWVNVTYKTIGKAYFNGTVTVEKPPMVIVSVQLDGSCSTGWPTTVSPQNIPFTTSGTQDFTVTVVVPQATPSSSIGRVVVSGIATYPGGSTTDSGTAIVNINQYYRAFGNVTPALGVDNPSDYTIVAMNYGNGEDVLKISIVDLSTHKDNDLSFTLSKTKTETLDQSDEETIELTVEYGLQAPSGQYKFTIRFTSEGDTSEFYDSIVRIKIDHSHGRTGDIYKGIGGIIALVIILVVIGVAFRKGYFKRLKKR